MFSLLRLKRLQTDIIITKYGISADLKPEEQLCLNHKLGSPVLTLSKMS